MILSKTKKIYTISFAAVIAVVISFAMCNVFFDQHIQASEGDEFVWNVSSLDEASDIAGFDITVPEAVPASMQKAENIAVFQLKTINKTKAVKQEWQSDDNSRLCLIQTRKITFPENAEDFSLGGVTGKKVYVDAIPECNRPALIGYYWIVNDMAYILCGTITESIDEQSLNDIVKLMEF